MDNPPRLGCAIWDAVKLTLSKNRPVLAAAAGALIAGLLAVWLAGAGHGWVGPLYLWGPFVVVNSDVAIRAGNSAATISLHWDLAFLAGGSRANAALLYT